MRRWWFSGAVMAEAAAAASTSKLKEASFLALPAIEPLTSMMMKAMVVAFTCILALGGAMVGVIIGAIKGQTTETGFLRGSGIGAVTGAITAVQLLELRFDGESLSKVALLSSMVEGKVFMEWVGPAMLKAYQWQVSDIETTYMEMSDIYDTGEEHRRLSHSSIQRIPLNIFRSSSAGAASDSTCCSICLQDFEEGVTTRRLPQCEHFFHMDCLDSWLIRKASCPICRDSICGHDDDEHYAGYY